MGNNKFIVQEKSKVINKQFVLLHAIAIILVVFNHKGGGGVNILDDWFTSYRLPLFIFVSGYFFKLSYTEDMLRFILRKIKHLILPYFGWNLVYGLINMLLHKFQVIDYAKAEITFHDFFIAPWIHGHQYIFNLAAWFVLILFLVQLSYFFFRWICEKVKFKNDFIMLLLFFVLSASCAYVSQKIENVGITLYSPFLKTGFFLIFFHFGYYYRNKLEKFDTLNSFIYFGILFAIQGFINNSEVGNYNYVISWLNFNDAMFLPIIVSFTGILLWLRITRILVRAIGDNKIITFIGNNTWDIMTHHIFVFFLINCLLFALCIPDFDVVQFKTEAYYAYIYKSHHILLLYATAGVALPLLYRYYASKLSNRLRKHEFFQLSKIRFLKNKMFAMVYSFWKRY